MKFCQFFCHFDPIWIKFGTGDFHIMCSSVREYHENRRSERHILLRRVSEFISLVPTFIWVKFSIRNLHIMMPSICVVKITFCFEAFLYCHKVLF